VIIFEVFDNEIVVFIFIEMGVRGIVSMMIMFVILFDIFISCL